MLTFAMSLMILLVFKRSTKVSEKSDITKSWATFCCPGTYKKGKIKVLRNLGYIEKSTCVMSTFLLSYFPCSSQF